MATHHKISEFRVRAVDQHDHQAQDFEGEYRRKEVSGHFASSFLYGRNKIDGLLYSWLEARPQNSHVLDIGCGTGEQMRQIRECGFNVCGVEPAPRMRALAFQNNPEAKIVDGSISDIPFPDESFDAVLAIEVLRYLHREDVRIAYSEMLRVLKPGGQGFVTLVNLWAADGFFVFDKLKRLTYWIMDREQPAHCEFVTPVRTQRELEAAGASQVQIHGRLIGPIRMGYKISPRFGRSLARSLSSLDDAISEMRWTCAFAGHLVVIFSKPK